MIYLLIIVGLGQLLIFIYCSKMLISVKRRHRIIDARIRNLTQWVITSNQSIMAQLDTMNDLMKKMPGAGDEQPEPLQQLHTETGKSHQPSETLLRPVNGYAG